MPKLKTHSGAKKRFKITATGKVKVRGAGLRHNLSNKNRKRNRQKKNFIVLSRADARMIRRLLPHHA